MIWLDEENDPQDASAGFVVHGGLIEISDSDDDGQDDSPTVHLVPAKSQAVKKGECEWAFIVHVTDTGSKNPCCQT